MLNHSCVCPDALDRCDRCDLLLDFPGLHLVSVTQAPSGLVLEVESCVPVQGCPGCGVIATGHGRVVVEVIDAPWAGRPVRVRWRKRRWICHEDVCAVVSFVEQDPEVCAPRGLLSTRAIRWSIGQLRREGATIQGLARQLARPGTPSGLRSAPSWPRPLTTRSGSRTCRSWAWTNTSGTTVTRVGAGRKRSPGWWT